MTQPLLFRIYERQHLVFSGAVDQAVELGRQRNSDEQPYSLRQVEGQWRLVVAGVREDTISRRHLLIEPMGENKVRLKNLRDIPIGLPDNNVLEPMAACELTLPLTLPMGKRTVRVMAQDEQSCIQNLPEATRPPLSRSGGTTRIGALLLSAGVDADSVMRWLQGTMEVVQSASNSPDFMEHAAQAVLDLVGLDTARVLMLSDDHWAVEILKWSAQIHHEPDWLPSQQVLARVRQEKKTFWQVPNPSVLTAPSLMGVKAVVAAPILDRGGNVIGALYGDRRHESRLAGLPNITQAEAMLVELLACGVAAGLARIEQERAALTARVQFEQFFTPELSRLLADRPDLLQGQDAEVTLLFSDIRGFSRISERLGPAKTVDWVSHVMDVLSDCVQAHKGVLVDYVGDELFAMWGAPEKESLHASLACQAALDMLRQVAPLNERWQSTLGEPFVLGIGVNTGLAHVGNTGSRRKFKYGPLGNTVNLASRVQGVTKFLKTNLLITQSTHAQLTPSFRTRRICKAKVVNIEEPVDLYEVVASDQPNWAVLKESYENALAQFEKKELRPAARILGRLVGEYQSDGPSLVLLARAVNALVDETKFKAVWALAEK
jgi:adenylate cyclase